MKKTVILFLAMVVGASSFAAGGTNCRLIVHVQYKDGNKKVKFEETGAASHAECKLAAQNRELDSDGDEDIKKIKVILNYRELSVLSDAEAAE